MNEEVLPSKPAFLAARKRALVTELRRRTRLLAVYGRLVSPHTPLISFNFFFFKIIDMIGKQNVEASKLDWSQSHFSSGLFETRTLRSNSRHLEHYLGRVSKLPRGTLVSYSCMDNMEKIVKNTTWQKVLNISSTSRKKGCHCRNKDNCPLGNNCLASGLVYNANVTTKKDITGRMLYTILTAD